MESGQILVLFVKAFRKLRKGEVGPSFIPMREQEGRRHTFEVGPSFIPCASGRSRQLAFATEEATKRHSESPRAERIP